MAAWSQVWCRPEEGYLHPEAHGRLMLGPRDVAADGHAGLAASRSVGLCRANTVSLCCLAPLSYETRVLTLAVADMEKKYFLKNEIAIVRDKYFRHRYRDILTTVSPNFEASLS